MLSSMLPPRARMRIRFSMISADVRTRPRADTTTGSLVVRQLSQAWSCGLAGDLLLGRRDLAAADEDVLADLPGVLLERLALAVEPEHEDVAVAGQELLDLAALVIEELLLLRGPKRAAAAKSGS